MKRPDKNDTVLLLGGSGQLGSEWKLTLDSMGIGYQAPSSSELNLEDPQAVPSFLSRQRYSMIINCAAYTNVDQAETDQKKCFALNEYVPELLAKYCVSNSIPLVHYSTDYVFSGNPTDRSYFPGGYPVDHDTDPQNIYGQSKLQGEIAIRKTLEDHLILRVSWLCGVEGKNFVKTMLRLSETMDIINVVDDQFGSPTFTFDVVQTTLSLMHCNVTGTRHVSSNGLLTWADLASLTMQLSNKKTSINRISTKDYPVRAKRPLFSKLDCTLTENDTGEAMPDWETSLKKLLQKLNAHST